MKQYLSALLLVLVTLLYSAPSQAGDPVVMGMCGWEYFDVESCFTGPGICYGSNPTSPYGSPYFPHPDTGLDRWEIFLKRDEAIVVFLRTPPQNSYYAFTQYLMRSAGVASPEFARLSDSLNNLQIGTTKTADNQTVFNQCAVLVWTPDLGTRYRIYSMRASLGVDSRSINFIPLPVSIPDRSFKFGSGSDADSFNMLMCTALPANQTAMNANLDEAPFFVAKVGPNVTGILSASPTIGYVDEITGRSEGVIFPNAQRALDMLTCAGDNHDALYSRDTGVILVGNLDDFVLVVGVNHPKTGNDPKAALKRISTPTLSRTIAPVACTAFRSQRQHRAILSVSSLAYRSSSSAVTIWSRFRKFALHRAKSSSIRSW